MDAHGPAAANRTWQMSDARATSRLEAAVSGTAVSEAEIAPHTHTDSMPLVFFNEAQLTFGDMCVASSGLAARLGFVFVSDDQPLPPRRQQAALALALARRLLVLHDALPAGSQDALAALLLALSLGLLLCCCRAPARRCAAWRRARNYKTVTRLELEGEVPEAKSEREGF